MPIYKLTSTRTVEEEGFVYVQAPDMQHLRDMFNNDEDRIELEDCLTEMGHWEETSFHEGGSIEISDAPKVHISTIHKDCVFGDVEEETEPAVDSRQEAFRNILDVG